MFNKKELEEIKETLNFIKENQQKTVTELTEIKSEYSQRQTESKQIISDILTKINLMEEKQFVLGNSLQKEINLVSELVEQFESRINSLKILENKASKKLFEETNMEIRSQLDSLFKTTKNYQELENHLLRTKNHLDLIVTEINKFNSIAQQVKTADFQLANFARQITKTDQEKLKLMQENDKLKTLISKERRRQRMF